MMKRFYDLNVRRLLTFLTMIFLALTILGCNDPMVADMENRRQEIGFMVEQELQRCRNASQVTSKPVSLPPAQAVDMSAERRELDRMVEQGIWSNLTPSSAPSQTEAFHPAP
jgi:hypothetical protein